MTTPKRGWRTKAVERREENRELKKRIKEKNASRENWKQKYTKEKARADESEKELQAIKKNFKNLPNETKLNPAPKNHSYSNTVVMICLMIKLKTSAGFRAIQNIILIMSLNTQLNCKAPSHSTILRWTKKFGYHQMQKDRDLSGKWVLIIDESVQFGQNKLLVIYGLRLQDIDFTQPLHFHNLVPFTISSKPSWNGDAISQQIEDIKNQVEEVAYAVADDGNPIRKALNLSGIPHVYDLTHYIALVLKHIYENDEVFTAFNQKMSRMRGSKCLSKVGHIVPPNQRSHSRFMNLKPISDWGMAVLSFLEKYDKTEYFEEEKAALKWVEDYRHHIQELAHLNKKINEIQQLLKSEGICKETIGICKEKMKDFKAPGLQRFRNKLNEYFDQTKNSLPVYEKILCSSDIIESTFGKYKNYMQGNPMIGITDLSLSIGAFTGNLEKEEVKQACEENAIKNVQAWSKNNIAKTAFSKRKELLKVG